MSEKPKPEQDAETGRFVTGNIGGGRSKGSRNKLGEAFVDDLLADWKDNGKDAITLCRINDPAAYCRIVASLLPKEIDVRQVNPLDELSDDDIAIGYAAIRAAREAGPAGAGVSRPGGKAARSKEPDCVH